MRRLPLPQRAPRAAHCRWPAELAVAHTVAGCRDTSLQPPVAAWWSADTAPGVPATGACIAELQSGSHGRVSATWSCLVPGCVFWHGCCLTDCCRVQRLELTPGQHGQQRHGTAQLPGYIIRVGDTSSRVPHLANESAVLCSCRRWSSRSALHTPPPRSSSSWASRRASSTRGSCARARRCCSSTRCLRGSRATSSGSSWSCRPSRAHRHARDCSLAQGVAGSWLDALPAGCVHTSLELALTQFGRCVDRARVAVVVHCPGWGLPPYVGVGAEVGLPGSPVTSFVSLCWPLFAGHSCGYPRLWCSCVCRSDVGAVLARFYR